MSEDTGTGSLRFSYWDPQLLTITLAKIAECSPWILNRGSRRTDTSRGKLRFGFVQFLESDTSNNLMMTMELAVFRIQFTCPCGMFSCRRRSFHPPGCGFRKLERSPVNPSCRSGNRTRLHELRERPRGGTLVDHADRFSKIVGSPYGLVWIPASTGVFSYRCTSYKRVLFRMSDGNLD